MLYFKKYRKLSCNFSHRINLIKNLCRALIKYNQIKTTLIKARILKPFMERLITFIKNKSLLSYKWIRSHLNISFCDFSKIVSLISYRYLNLTSGYTRILRCGYRLGDCCPMAIIQFI